MTGFANAQAEYGGIRINWELRSVNHRFLDLSLRLPEDMKALETACREQLAARLSRGKVDSTLRLKQLHQDPAQGKVNTEALQRLLHLSDQVTARVHDAPPLNVAEILRWPGVVEDAVGVAHQVEKISLSLGEEEL